MFDVFVADVAQIEHVASLIVVIHLIYPPILLLLLPMTTFFLHNVAVVMLEILCFVRFMHIICNCLVIVVVTFTVRPTLTPPFRAKADHH